MYETNGGSAPSDLRHAAHQVLTRRDEHPEATVAYAAEILRTLDEVERLIATRVRTEVP